MQKEKQPSIAVSSEIYSNLKKLLVSNGTSSDFYKFT